jgi:surface protein
MKFQVAKAYIKELINHFWHKEVIANDKQHLQQLITREVKIKGEKCSLNHINVCNINDMRKLFEHSDFNGDISQWDTSNVKTMASMFFCSKFNGDISSWNVSKVEDMEHMFHGSQFNKDISKWDITNVKDMTHMFASSKFNKDISKWDVSSVLIMDYMFFRSNFKKDLLVWKPYKLEYAKSMFRECKALVPYWADYDNAETRSKAIDSYLLSKELSDELNNELNVSETNKKKKPKL